jgi:hypothetical protein
MERSHNILFVAALEDQWAAFMGYPKQVNGTYLYGAFTANYPRKLLKATIKVDALVTSDEEAFWRSRTIMMVEEHIKSNWVSRRCTAKSGIVVGSLFPG